MSDTLLNSVNSLYDFERKLFFTVGGGASWSRIAVDGKAKYGWGEEEGVDWRVTFLNVSKSKSYVHTHKSHKQVET